MVNKYFLISFMLFCGSSFAETRTYDVEIILFEDTTARYIDSEQWPNIPNSEISETNQIDSDNSDISNNQRFDFELDNYLHSDLTPEQAPEYPAHNSVIDIIELKQHLLNDEAEKINHSAHFKILLRKSWLQIGLDKNAAIDIEINSKNYVNSTSQNHNKLIDSRDLFQQKNDEMKSYITGHIKVELARYLHVYTDLIYRKPQSHYSPIEIKPLNVYKNYSFKTHRRMRSNELHYIDHPLVGMLIKILPVKDTTELEQTDIKS